MEKKQSNAGLLSLLVAVLSVSMTQRVSGQITTACTGALISSFTPCLNFITSSTNGGGSPTDDCCKAFASVVTSSKDCACLILTGNVPFSLPINRTMAISLPKFCNSTSVPLQCTGTSSPLPSPGTPVVFGPSLPPLPPFTASAPPPPIMEAPPAPAPVLSTNRPLVLPNSAAKLNLASSVAVFKVLVLAILFVQVDIIPRGPF